MENDQSNLEVSGSIPFGAGVGSVVRIPIPGSGNLTLSLRPDDPYWKDKTTSSFFIQDASGKKRNLRIDLGKNKDIGGTVNYHWNKKGLADRFGVTNHQFAGRTSAMLHRTTAAYK